MTLALKRALLATVAAVVLLLTACAPALAASPWWHLSSAAEPTNVHAGPGRNEVQTLTVSATGGEFVLLETVRSEVKFFKWNASPEEVQAGLQEIYGPGNVQVTGGRGDEEGTKPYTITFTGALAKRPVAPLDAEFSTFFLNCEGATGLGCRHEASIAETPRGAADAEILLTATNLGDERTSGPVTIADKLPPGLEAVTIEAFAGASPNSGAHGEVSCSLEALSCVLQGPEGPQGTIPPYDQLVVHIGVDVQPSAKSGDPNQVSVTGGQAPPASLSRPVTISDAPTPFGVQQYELTPEEEGGAPDTQAGSHPFQLTTTMSLNQVAGAQPAAMAKDLNFDWPAGLIGNPTPIQRCTLGQFLASEGGAQTRNQCPLASVVGVARVTYNEPKFLGAYTETTPVYNLEPTVGEPARFGFLLPITPVFIDPSVRTGRDYGITVHALNISQTAAFLQAQVTVWGVPGDPSHDSSRGIDCLLAQREGSGSCSPLGQSSPPPFLSMPTSCQQPFSSSVSGDSWSNPHEVLALASFTAPFALDGCNRLPSSPSIKVAPDSSAASTPSGLNVDVHVPQDAVLVAKGLAESAVRDITVTLPAGVAVNPARGDGLQACAEGLVGFTGFSELQPGSQTATFTSALPAPLAPGVNFCPEASKIATVKLSTPLLPNPLTGAVYLATQNENPFGSLIAMYIVATDPVSGVLVKLAGEVHLSETGQITTTFKNSPQVAFEDAELHFFGGERAPLATPAHCGPYTTEAAFTPWAAESGEPARTAQSTFQVTSGPHGGACPPAALPFSPSLAGGTVNNQAGSFSPLSTTIGREDGQQDLQSVQLHMPPGLSGLLAGVKLCPEAQANDGTCGPESLIGETTVSAGVGSDPVSVTGGRVYLTESYAGAPFGLSIVNPVKAGPFDLEHDTSNPAQQPACDCVVVRARVDVDPRSAALTVTTDTSGPHAIPHLIDGIPVQIKAVNVLVNRPGFTFNPTNCRPMSVTGVLAGGEGASSPLSVPFQVANCAVLRFTPTLSVTTAAKPSRTNGASLSFRIAYPKGAMGSQSWFNEAKFDIPRQLPARLTTIQKACLAATFEANRGACPAASRIGHAIVHTPVLPVPLEGPVYFVSYGGAKFPDAVLVLDGYGVHIELHGETFINGKTGVTSATFRNTPDVPFESIEVSVPTGPFSEFGANLPASAHGSFCGQKLIMPTFFKAQNGLEIHQNARVGVTGCSTRAKVVAHRVKGHNITLTVYAPAAGKLKASGGGLTAASKTVSGTETVTLTIHPTHGGSARRRVHVVFTPSHGRRQTLTIALRA
jgi:hypothetical protein